MYMAYTTNPHLPRVRMQAVRLVQQGWSTRQVSRHLGYSQSAVVKWLARARYLPQNIHTIPTVTSRPHHHPRELHREVISRILDLRRERNQCAEILHHRLTKEGLLISLSSVKRVLKRYHVTRYSPWKKWHQYPPRPLPSKPGILVQVDTVWDESQESRLYVYTLLDVCTRWGYALASEKIDTFRSISFVREAVFKAPFRFQTLQSDHGPEFSRRFTSRMLCQGISHRHSRIRRPTDNGHLERFNRTLQEECLHRIPRSLKSWNREIPEYLSYYNQERPHMALLMQTPLETLKRFQAID